MNDYTRVEGTSRSYYVLLMGLVFFLLMGLLSFLYVEIQGHGVTNMTNQIVWGAPHVFAIALLVMASGALNLASMSTVFATKHYKQFGRFSAFLAIALLVGGLMVLALDLARPDRMLYLMMYMNFKSMFTMNVFLYSGFVVLCFLYLWAMFQQERFVKIAGSSAFAWRLVLTTGTGSIFGVIHAREVFHSAITGPTFIALSLTSGTAICILLLTTTFRLTHREMDRKLIHGMRNMLVFFTVLVAYLLIVEKFTKSYSPAFHDVERWLLTGDYSWLYWGGVVLSGVVVPLVITLHQRWGNSVNGIMTASVFAIVGEFAFVSHILIAGQAYPFTMFPGYEMSSLFLDGVVATYVPNLVEILLGLGGIAMTGLIYLLGIRFFRLLPARATTPDGWNPWNP